MGFATGIVILFLLFWFKEGIKGTARTAEVAINVVNDTAEDSLRTYTSKVAVLNAQARAETAKDIGQLEAIYTNDDIENLLKTSTMKGEDKAKA